MSTLKTLTINGQTYSVVPVIPAASVTLRTKGWVGSEGAYSQVVTLAGVTSHTKVDLQPTPEQVEIFLAKTLAFVAENNNGVVTVYSIGDKPRNDYTIQVTMTEVEGNAPIRGNTVGLPNPQPDWNQDDPTKADYIKNKPVITGGDTSVYMGPQEPTEESVKIWIDTSGPKVVAPNALRYAVDEDGKPYIGSNGEVGYTTEGWFDDETGEFSEDAGGYPVSGCIPVTPVSKVRFTNVTMDDMGSTIVLYDRNFNIIAFDDPYRYPELSVELDDEFGSYITAIDFASFASSGFGGVTQEEFANVAYFRFHMHNIDGNPTVFIDTLTVPASNLLEQAINADGTPFVGTDGIVGYFRTGSENNGVFTENEDGYYFSGFIPVIPSTKLYFNGIKFDNMEYCIYLYGPDFNYIGSEHLFDYNYREDAVEDAAKFNDDYDEIAWVDFAKLFSASYGEVAPNQLANTAYIRLQGIYEFTEECAVSMLPIGNVSNDSTLRIRNADGTFHEIKAKTQSEEWIFELSDGTTVTKRVVVK